MHLNLPDLEQRHRKVLLFYVAMFLVSFGTITYWTTTPGTFSELDVLVALVPYFASFPIAIGYNVKAYGMPLEAAIRDATVPMQYLYLGIMGVAALVIGVLVLGFIVLVVT